MALPFFASDFKLSRHIFAMTLAERGEGKMIRQKREVRREKGEAKKTPAPSCPAIGSHLKAPTSMVLWDCKRLSSRPA